MPIVLLYQKIHLMLTNMTMAVAITLTVAITATICLTILEHSARALFLTLFWRGSAYQDSAKGQYSDGMISWCVCVFVWRVWERVLVSGERG